MPQRELLNFWFVYINSRLFSHQLEILSSANHIISFVCAFINFRIDNVVCCKYEEYWANMATLWEEVAGSMDWFGECIFGSWHSALSVSQCWVASRYWPVFVVWLRAIFGQMLSRSRWRQCLRDSNCACLAEYGWLPQLDSLRWRNPCWQLWMSGSIFVRRLSDVRASKILGMNEDGAIPL